MKKLLLLTTVTTAICCALVCLRPAQGQNAASTRVAKPAPPLKIAVVDVGAVETGYLKAEHFREELSSTKKAALEKDRTLAEEGRRLVAQLRELKADPESTDAAELQEQVQHAASDYQIFRTTADRDYKRLQIRVKVAIDQDIAGMLKKFAEQNGYTLILRVDRRAMAAKNYQTLNATLQQDVIQCGKNVDDITEAMLAQLNALYETEDKSSGSEGNEPERKSSPTTNRKPAGR